MWEILEMKKRAQAEAEEQKLIQELLRQGFQQISESLITFPGVDKNKVIAARIKMLSMEEKQKEDLKVQIEPISTNGTLRI